MSGRHLQTAGRRRTQLWLAGLASALVATLIAVLAGPAGASTTIINAQLSLSGLASASNPLGGSQIGVLPGDKVSFTAAGVPTAGLDQLGIGSVVGGLLNGLTKFQITADFSKLPGGRANTVLSGSTAATFAFPQGTYNFTWTAQKVTVGLLGTSIVPINLDGNQLKQAGIALNASNQYVGQIVASNNPPQGGLSVQVPGISVAPSLPVVGQAPTISIPGVSLPTVHISVPDLNPSSSAPSSGSTAGATAKASTSTPAPGLTYKPPAVSVPQLAVPGGSGTGSGGGSNGGGGFRLGVLDSGSAGGLTVGNLANGTSASGSTGGSASSDAINGDSSGTHKTVDLASSSASPSGQLPVLLAILAVITLAVVAGLYARLYLLGRKSTSG